MKIRTYASRLNKLTLDCMYYRRHGQRMQISFGDYLRLRKFKSLDRGEFSCLVNNSNISFSSPFWFLHSLDEIYVQEVYRYVSQVQSPTILDCGANIGLSVLYFKHQNPSAKILAFEPDPTVFKQLKQNIETAGYSDVQLINSAVWTEDTELSFASEGSVGGRIEEGSSGVSKNSVSAVRLLNYLKYDIDFLKIDIEGAEYDVLKDCKENLNRVQNLFIEYHLEREQRQYLHEILDWVNAAGFRYYIREAWPNMKFPYLRHFDDHFQMQLNIFCFR